MQTAALILATAHQVHDAAEGAFDEDAFNRVVRHREAQLLRIAWRMLGNWADAEDVVQDVFVRLYRHGLKFPDETGLHAWLYRVTANLCIDRSRRIKPAAELPELRASDLSAETEMLRHERKQALMAALATLPARERAAVVLREIEGLSTGEVATILGSAEGTIRSQISKAILHLRAALSKEGL
jgi:RNA polymerase sigma-70 factor, ECF subfamily